MTTYFTADTHFGHTNVIKYCDRPWETVEAMNAGLVANWNATVKPQDTVYCLGDFSLQPGWMAKTTPQLNGRKILVAGNHDLCWRKEFAVQRYLDAGWSEVHRGTLDYDLQGTPVQLSHIPYESHDERYQNRRPVDDGRWLLHGHVHTCWKVKCKMINVGVDVWDYKPVSEAQLLEIIRPNLWQRSVQLMKEMWNGYC